MKMKLAALALATSTLLFTFFTGCSSSRDNIPATAAIQCSNGSTEIINSINYYSGISTIGVRRRFDNPATIILHKDEICSITFYCSSCGKNENQEVAYPSAASQIWHCDCPEVIDENHHSREYIPISITTIN